MVDINSVLSPIFGIDPDFVIGLAQEEIDLENIDKSDLFTSGDKQPAKKVQELKPDRAQPGALKQEKAKPELVILLKQISKLLNSDLESAEAQEELETAIAKVKEIGISAYPRVLSYSYGQEGKGEFDRTKVFNNLARDLVATRLWTLKAEIRQAHREQNYDKVLELNEELLSYKAHTDTKVLRAYANYLSQHKKAKLFQSFIVAVDRHEARNLIEDFNREPVKLYADSRFRDGLKPEAKKLIQNLVKIGPNILPEIFIAADNFAQNQREHDFDYLTFYLNDLAREIVQTPQGREQCLKLLFLESHDFDIAHMNSSMSNISFSSLAREEVVQILDASYLTDRGRDLPDYASGGVEAFTNKQYRQIYAMATEFAEPNCPAGRIINKHIDEIVLGQELENEFYTELEAGDDNVGEALTRLANIPDLEKRQEAIAAIWLSVVHKKLSLAQDRITENLSIYNQEQLVSLFLKNETNPGSRIESFSGYDLGYLRAVEEGFFNNPDEDLASRKRKMELFYKLCLHDDSSVASKRLAVRLYTSVMGIIGVNIIDSDPEIRMHAVKSLAAIVDKVSRFYDKDIVLRQLLTDNPGLKLELSMLMNEEDPAYKISRVLALEVIAALPYDNYDPGLVPSVLKAISDENQPIDVRENFTKQLTKLLEDLYVNSDNRKSLETLIHKFSKLSNLSLAQAKEQGIDLKERGLARRFVELFSKYIEVSAEEMPYYIKLEAELKVLAVQIASNQPQLSIEKNLERLAALVPETEQDIRRAKPLLAYYLETIDQAKFKDAIQDLRLKLYLVGIRKFKDERSVFTFSDKADLLEIGDELGGEKRLQAYYEYLQAYSSNNYSERIREILSSYLEMLSEKGKMVDGIPLLVKWNWGLESYYEDNVRHNSYGYLFNMVLLYDLSGDRKKANSNLNIIKAKLSQEENQDLDLLKFIEYLDAYLNASNSEWSGIKGQRRYAKDSKTKTLYLYKQARYYKYQMPEINFRSFKELEFSDQLQLIKPENLPETLSPVY